MDKIKINMPPLKQIPIDEPVPFIDENGQSVPRQELYDTLYAKYYLQYEELEDSDRRHFDNQEFENRLATLKLLENLRHKKFFRESKPEFDLEYVIVLLGNFYINDVRTELTKMYTWLLADPKRAKKNYRRFVLAWLNKWRDNGKKSIEIHNHYHGEGEE